MTILMGEIMKDWKYCSDKEIENMTLKNKNT